MKGEPPTSSLPNYHAKLSENPAFTQLEPDPDIWAKMTKRERQAFIGVCEGLSDKQIAFRSIERMLRELSDLLGERAYVMQFESLRLEDCERMLVALKAERAGDNDMSVYNDWKAA